MYMYIYIYIYIYIDIDIYPGWAPVLAMGWLWAGYGEAMEAMGS